MLAIVGRLAEKIFGALVSHFSESLRSRALNRASLRLRHGREFEWGSEDQSGAEVPTLSFFASVLGQSSVVFWSATVEVMVYKRALESPDHGLWLPGPPALKVKDSSGVVTLPRRVEPGDRLSAHFDARELTKRLRNTGRTKSWLRFVVEDGTGTLHREIFPVPDVDALAQLVENKEQKRSRDRILGELEDEFRLD